MSMRATLVSSNLAARGCTWHEIPVNTAAPRVYANTLLRKLPCRPLQRLRPVMDFTMMFLMVVAMVREIER
jgi:hypothetical protein